MTFGLGASSANASCNGETPPTITDISPSAGLIAGGTVVTITGSSLGCVTTTFGGTVATDSVAPTGTKVVVTSPPGTLGPVTVTITNPNNGTFANATATTSYTYGDPAITLSSAAPAQVDDRFNVTATFSSSVADFTISDVNVTNGTASDLTGSGAAYSFTVTPSRSGPVNIEVPAGAVASGASLASNTLVRTAVFPPNPQVPRVTLFTPSSVVAGPFTVTTLFSTNVTGFTADDIRIRNGVISNFAGSGLSYSFTVTPTGGKKRKQITISVPGKVAESAQGLYNTPSAPLQVKANRNPREAMLGSVSDLSGLIKLKDATGIDAKVHDYGGVLAVGDVNKDGYDDLLVGVLSNQIDYPATVKSNKPILLTFNPKSFSYEVNQSFQRSAEKLIWQRRAAIADFDGDGDNDIFVAGQGTDGLNALHCGEQNALVENRGKDFVNATAKLPRQSDYSHGLVVANLDGDRAKELLVFNSPYLDKDKCPKGIRYVNRSYGLDYDNGTYSLVALSGSETDLNRTEDSPLAIHSATAADFNGDGLADLAIGTDHTIKILIAEGIRQYAHGISFAPPADYKLKFDADKCLTSDGQCNTPYSEITTYDFDRDGDLDIIASLLNQTKDGKWRGYYLQALRNDGARWSDVSNRVFGSQSQDQGASGRWCFSLIKADVDGDGSEDLICSQYKGFDYNAADAIRLYRSGKFVSLSEAIPGLPAKLKIPGINSALTEFLSDEPTNLQSVRLGKKAYILGIAPQFKNDVFSGLIVEGVPITPLR